MGELGTDESIALYYGGDIASLYKYSFASNFGLISNCYNDYYVVISRANTIIDQANQLKNKLSPAFEAQVVNECKVMRAYAYFQLVQTFGPVTIIDKPQTTVDYGLPRNAVKEVYDFIIDDLASAINSHALLQSKSSTGPGRIIEDAAKGILGKVYLTMASSKKAGIVDKLMNSVGKTDYGYSAIPESATQLYQKADSVLSLLVGKYQLEPVYGKLFSSDYKNKLGENMWELEFSAITPAGLYFYKRYGILYFPQDNSNNTTNASGWTQVMYTPYLFDLYSNGDKRKTWNLVNYMIYKSDTTTVTTFNPSDAETNEGYYSWCGVTKFRNIYAGSLIQQTNYTDVNNQPQNVVLLRYADILLMYAEAELGMQNGAATQAAVDAVNLVRQRARGFDANNNPIPASATPDFKNFTTSTLTVDSLLRERMFELCFENHRWYDLTRTGTLIQQYNAPIIVGDYKQGIITDNNYLYPIPDDQIQRSTNKDGFFQNPGY